MTRKGDREAVREAIGALKGRNGWTDSDLARRLECSRWTIANLRKDPGQIRHETVRRLFDLYEKYCGREVMA